MSWSTIGLIIWFAVYGISFFIGFAYAGVVLAVLALFVALCLAFGK